MIAQIYTNRHYNSTSSISLKSKILGIILNLIKIIKLDLLMTVALTSSFHMTLKTNLAQKIASSYAIFLGSHLVKVVGVFIEKGV